VLTGISATFRDLGSGMIEITVHVVDGALDALIYDLEIFYGEQQPHWQGATPVQGPTGWSPGQISGGLGFSTSTSPLRTCQPVKFVIQVAPPFTGDSIAIRVTDKTHKNLGYIYAQRVRTSWPAWTGGRQSMPDFVGLAAASAKPSGLCP